VKAGGVLLGGVAPAVACRVMPYEGQHVNQLGGLKRVCLDLLILSCSLVRGRLMRYRILQVFAFCQLCQRMSVVPAAYLTWQCVAAPRAECAGQPAGQTCSPALSWYYAEIRAVCMLPSCGSVAAVGRCHQKAMLRVAVALSQGCMLFCSLVNLLAGAKVLVVACVTCFWLSSAAGMSSCDIVLFVLGWEHRRNNKTQCKLL